MKKFKSKPRAPAYVQEVYQRIETEMCTARNAVVALDLRIAPIIAKLPPEDQAEIEAALVAYNQTVCTAISKAGVVALGVALFAKFGKGKSSGTTSTQKAYSYKDIQDAYWYGNERAFAGYDYRTDPYVMNPDNNAMLAYQAKMQAQMERLYGVVEKYLPEAGNSVIALDGEQVGRIITPSVNRSLGDLTVLSERGN